MEGLGFSIILILIPILIIGIPIGLSYITNRILKKKGVSPKWRLLSLLPILIVGYLIYDALYPNKDFYRADFKEVTGVEMPTDSDFEYKTATFPDQFGDYTSISLIKVDNRFYNELENILISKGFTENFQHVNSNEFDRMKSKIKEMKIEKEYGKENGDKFYYVGFLSDKQTLIIERISW